MTKEEILDMPAGFEFDQLMIDKIMKPDTGLMSAYSFFPSRNIQHAFDVVERIHELIYNNELSLDDDYNYLTLSCLGGSSGYAASFDCLLEEEWYDDISNYKYAARADDAPLAICRAALLAVIDNKK